MSSSCSDTDREIINLLLEEFWVHEDTYPAEYRLINEAYPRLQRLFQEKYHMRLGPQRNRGYFRLEKVPVEPFPWMGITTFRRPLDYTLLCATLSILSNKGADEQFLFHSFLEELKLLLGELDLRVKVEWEEYAHRLSLKQVFSFLESMGLLYRHDGDIDGFLYRVDVPVLYEIKPLLGSFLRHHQRDFADFGDAADFIRYEHQQLEGESVTTRLKRTLLLTPALLRHEAPDGQFQNLSMRRQEIGAEFLDVTGYDFEIYGTTAMLMQIERPSGKTLFGNGDSIMSRLMLLFAAFVREKVDHNPDLLLHERVVAVSFVTYEAWLEEFKQQTVEYWHKEPSQQWSMARLTSDLLEEMAGWKMVTVDYHDDMIYFEQPFMRNMGVIAPETGSVAV